MASGSLPQAINIVEQDQMRRLHNSNWKHKTKYQQVGAKLSGSTTSKANKSFSAQSQVDAFATPRRVAAWEYDPKGPKKAGALTRKKMQRSNFRIMYDRGDVPVQIDHCATNRLIWKIPADQVDLFILLPLFCDGLREKDDPYRFLSFRGTMDLLKYGGARVAPVVPSMIHPLKKALDTRDMDVLTLVLHVLQRMALVDDSVAVAVVAQSKSLLPVLNIFKDCTCVMTDATQEQSHKSISELVTETLQLLETHGGEGAYASIKYMVPTYETCRQP